MIRDDLPKPKAQPSASTSAAFNSVSPAFSIQYPGDLSVQKPASGIYFEAKKGFFGLPNLIVSQADPYSSPAEAVDNLINVLRLNKKGSKFKVIHSKEIVLEDGTSAVEALVQWSHPIISELYSCMVIAKGPNSIISATITDKNPLNQSAMGYVRSLRFLK